MFRGVNNLGETRVHCTDELPNLLLDRLGLHIVRIRSVLPVWLSFWHGAEYSFSSFARERVLEVNDRPSGQLRNDH